MEIFGAVVALFFTVVALVATVVLLRELWCWCFKINEGLAELQGIREELKKLNARPAPPPPQSQPAPISSDGWPAVR